LKINVTLTTALAKSSQVVPSGDDCFDCGSDVMTIALMTVAHTVFVKPSHSVLAHIFAEY